jgi:hypothetical protein
MIIDGQATESFGAVLLDKVGGDGRIGRVCKVHVSRPVYRPSDDIQTEDDPDRVRKSGMSSAVSRRGCRSSAAVGRTLY